MWSLGNEPTGRGFGSFTSVSPDRAELKGAIHDLRCEASVEMASGEPVAVWRLRLSNLANAPRKIRIASYRDLVMNEGGVERRDAAYNALHVGTTFVRPLAAIFARNRLLKNQSGDFASKRLSREIAFHAVSQSDAVRLVGYEDVRSRFLGLGQRRDPDALYAPPSPARAGGRGPALRFRSLRRVAGRNRIAAQWVGRTHTGRRLG